MFQPNEKKKGEYFETHARGPVRRRTWGMGEMMFFRFSAVEESQIIRKLCSSNFG